MEIGTHIPAYLFCEQFVQSQSVLDIFPMDEQGTRLLAKTASSVVVVNGSASYNIPSDDNELERIVASPNDLPFARESFGLVFFFAMGEHAHQENLDKFLRSARSIVSQGGLIALVVPNRDAKSFDKRSDPKLPSFFDFERALRRHFPHVTIFAERPLHGATLTPLGRRAASNAPLLDDRLLPSEGEMPSHFFALCSPRYRKVDDTIIVQMPYGRFIDRISERLDQFRGKMTVARSESDMRAAEIERLEIRVREMADQVEMVEICKKEKSITLSRLSDLERQIEMRDKLLAESEQAYEGQMSRLAEVEQQLHDSQRKTRQNMQETAELSQKLSRVTKEAEDAEKELERTLTGQRSARVEAKAKQRELDDVREEMAGTEADLAVMREESTRLRRETLSARERSTRLELEIKGIEDRQVEAASLKAELDRVRTLAASERERLERRVEENHARLLEEMKARSEIEQRAKEYKKLAENAEAITKKAQLRDESFEKKLSQLKEERDFLKQEQKEAERANNKMAQLARNGAEELNRHKQ